VMKGPRSLRRGVDMALVIGVAALLAACAGGDGQALVIDARTSPDGRTLALTVATCHRNPRADVEETRDEVRITVRPTRSSNDDDCSERITVRLEQPLGGRRVIDTSGGVTGEGADVEVRSEPSARPRR
jgi:hypothetical protein